MSFEDLTPGQQERAKACKTPEELFELAKAEGHQLSDDHLDAIVGGALFDNSDGAGCLWYTCPDRSDCPLHL